MGKREIVKSSAFCLVVLITPIAAVPEALATPPSCATLADELSRDLTPRTASRSSKADLDRIAVERTCLKSYPWPPKFMVVEDKLSKVTPDEMKAINEEVEGLVQEYKILGKRGLSKHADSDFVATRFYTQYVDKRDMVILDKVSEILYIKVLMANDMYQEGKVEIESAFKRWSILAKDTPWDEGDQDTYFSNETLDRIFILLKFQIYSALPTSSRNEAAAIAAEYLSARPLLANEINLLGDPGKDLLENAGCGD